MNKNCESLFYKNPAEDWNQALPIGNGLIGAMIYGGSQEEQLDLNHGTLWSGRPEMNFNKDLANVISDAKDLIGKGKYVDADNLLTNNLGHNDSASYEPAGTFFINLIDCKDAWGYERELNLDNAVFRTKYSVKGKMFSREIFASHPDKVIAIHLSAEGKGNLSFSARFSSVMLGNSSGEMDIAFNGVMPVLCRNKNLMWYDEQGHTGIAYQMRARFVVHGGSFSAHAGVAQILNADSAEIFLTIATNFKDWKTNPEESGIDQEQEAVRILNVAVAKGYDAVLRDHIVDYQALYRRSVIIMPDTEKTLLPTDARLESARKSDKFSPALAALLYNFGRYLTISASRPGSQPMNLQGLWNNLIFAPWASNYTTNINLEMNYWPTEGANLAECADPLMDFIFDVSEKGAVAAREIYGLDGWCLHHNSDLWRFASTATGQARWSLWPHAGGWLCRHLADHCRYSDDKDLAKRAFEIILGAAKFYLGYLVERDGFLTTNPSTSPENDFQEPVTGKMACVAYGSQMDRSIILDVFREVAEFAEITGRTDDPDVKRVADALSRLAPPKIGKFGELLEYGEAFDENDVHHRHLSHLYGAYPGTEFTPDGDPSLYEACHVSMNRRGDISTGWAMGWRAAIRARFRNPEKLIVVIKNFLTPVAFGEIPDHPGGGIYANLFDAHPPFQIDGNFGITAALQEAFVQSHRKTVDGLMKLELYPCLPMEWQSGTFFGFRAPHGLTVDLNWGDGSRKAVIHASRDIKFDLSGKTVFMKAGDTLQTLDC